MKAELTPDGTGFTLTRGAWSSTYPLADLDRWLEFYRRQPVDFPKSGQAYAESIAALESLTARLQTK